MLIDVFAFTFISLVILVILIDIIPSLNYWIGRIHIGRNKEKEVWSQSITNVAVRWLNKTPKIKVSDHTRLIIIDMLKGNYSKNTIQHWQEAALLLGLGDYLRCKGKDERIEKEIHRFLRKNFNHQGQWIQKPIHVDAAILAYSILKLDFVDQNHYKPALDYIWQLIKEHIGEDGTVGYRKSMAGYRYVDTIGFICPFLVSYGVKYDKPECIDLAVKQIQEYERYGMLERFHIPSHAYDVDTKAPLGLYGWGRGLGWYAIGLIDTWNEIPVNNKYKKVLEQSVIRFAYAALKHQQENGAWNWTVTRNEARADSSTTATLGYFMRCAAEIVEIPNECIVSVDKATEYLMNVTRRNGEIDFSQGDTKDIGVYSMLFNILPFTQGFSIRMINLNSNLKAESDYDKEIS
jgi:unsaturated rhamnogalacturonyl hydrolase